MSGSRSTSVKKKATKWILHFQFISSNKSTILALISSSIIYYYITVFCSFRSCTNFLKGVDTNLLVFKYVRNSFQSGFLLPNILLFGFVNLYSLKNINKVAIFLVLIWVVEEKHIWVVSMTSMRVVYRSISYLVGVTPVDDNALDISHKSSTITYYSSSICIWLMSMFCSESL